MCARSSRTFSSSESYKSRAVSWPELKPMVLRLEVLFSASIGCSSARQMENGECLTTTYTCRETPSRIELSLLTHVCFVTTSRGTKLLCNGVAAAAALCSVASDICVCVCLLACVGGRFKSEWVAWIVA